MFESIEAMSATLNYINCTPDVVDPSLYANFTDRSNIHARYPVI